MKLAFSWRPFVAQSLAVGLFVFLEWQTNVWTTKVVRAETLDRLVLPLIGFALVNLVVLLAGDRVARKLGRSDRGTYIAIGVLAASASHAVALAPAAYTTAAANGAVTLLIAVPALLGAAMGFLLHRSLGFSIEGDEPEALAGTVAEGKGGSTAYAATTGAEYYSGPLQVRDSSMAALIAAAIGSTLYMFMQALAESQDHFLAGMVSPKAFGSMPTMFLTGIFVFVLPFYIFVRKAHAFLQARGKAELKSYLLAGLVVPGLFFLGFLALLGPFALLFVLPWILPSIAAMAAYHRLAGMEPLSLPDDIEVSDRRTLIATDHPRRQTRRIVGPQGFGKAGIDRSAA
jgi:hypothetical protein